MAKGEKWALVGFALVILLIGLIVYFIAPEDVDTETKLSGFVQEREGESLQPATLTVAGELTRAKIVHTPKSYQGKFEIDKLSVSKEIEKTFGFSLFYSEDLQAYQGVCFLKEQKYSVQLYCDKSFSKFICIHDGSIAVFPADTVAEAQQICKDLNMQWITDSFVNE